MAAPLERKLAAIFSADVQGYSRLMGHDEEATVQTLKAYREVMTRLIQHYRGRVVDTPGDNLLAEFASVVDAVRCAETVQHELQRQNDALPASRQMQFRVGINLGDVLVDGARIYGDGVNIAARLEALAEPGGICVSEAVRMAVGTKLPHRFEYLGEQAVKNIAEPVRSYRVVIDPEAAAQAMQAVASAPATAAAPSKLPQRWKAIAVALLLLLIAAGAVGYFYSREAPLSTPASTAVSAKHRLAVLPFANLSADPDNEYFSDGITEELISKLSRLHELTVIARTSIMRYKATDKGIAEIGQELQVGTILEGSVRKAGERLRISAQLIDVDSQGHLWSQDYDRTLQDVFAIQSEVAQQVAEALQITLKPAETRQIAKAGTADLGAYNAYLRGLYHYNTWSKQGLEKSIEYFEQAITRDPAFAKAHAAMAFAYDIQGEFGYLPLDEAFPKVKKAAHRALEIDATTADAYTVLAVAATYYDYDWVRADEGFRRALELNPNSAVTHDWYGIIYLNSMGRHDEAIAHVQRAKEIDPLTAYIRNDLGWVYNQARRYDEAIAECEQIPEIDPNFYFIYYCRGFAYLQKGMHEEAVAAFERGVELAPGDSNLKSDLGIAYGAAGKKVQAERILEEIEEKAQREYVAPYALAGAHMAVGDLDSTFAWLDKMYEERDPWLIFVNVNPRYDRLRGDPRFQQLLRKIGFKELKGEGESL